MKQSRIFIYIFYFVICAAFDKYSSFCFVCGFSHLSVMECPPKKRASRRYNAPLLIFSSLYAIISKTEQKSDLLRPKQADTIK